MYILIWRIVSSRMVQTLFESQQSGHPETMSAQYNGGNRYTCEKSGLQKQKGITIAIDL